MAAVTIEQALEIALAHHQMRRWEDARKIYDQILTAVPAHPDALHLRGVLAGQTGDPQSAVQLITRAIRINPAVAEYHHNLGKFLLETQQRQPAIDAYRRAVELDPTASRIINNYGTALRDVGQLAGATAAFRRALEADPTYAEAASNLGATLREEGNLAQAVEACRLSIRIQPDYAPAHNNLANVLRDQKKLDEAIAAWGQALQIKPDFPAALSNLSAALRDIGRLEPAIASARQAIQLDPNYPQAYNNLALACRDAGRLDEALAAANRAIELAPSDAQPRNTLGLILAARGYPDLATSTFQKAIELQPDCSEAINNLANAFKDTGRLDDAIASYRKASEISKDPAPLESNRVYTLNFHPAFDSAAILAEHRRWEQIHAQPLKDQIRPHGNDRTLSRRLRVGYVSPDFRDHVVGRNLLPLLQNHDASAVEVFCYADLHRPDALTLDFQRAAHHWQNICGLSDADLAEKVRADQIDILLDLSLHMAGNRLLCFARKPAPIQATFAGYPGTTGLSAIDYRLTDPHLDPPGEFDADYAEKSIRLTDTFWCYQACAYTPAVNPPPAATKGYITFGCLNNFCKINDAVLNLWAAVLSAVANSRLLLLAWPGEHRVELQNKMQGMGIAAERIQFAAPCPLEQYLSLYHQIDIGLDTFPYNGHTTSLDSYYMGVPVITVAGRTVVGRAGLSQLTNLKLTQLIAGSPQDYVQIARSLAGDLDQLKQLRETLRERMEASPLMDARGFARSVEAAYRRMWGSWCAQS